MTDKCACPLHDIVNPYIVDEDGNFDDVILLSQCVDVGIVECHQENCKYWAQGRCEITGAIDRI